jgi:Mn2+/Fe2+ NRAMP family transporter
MEKRGSFFHPAACVALTVLTGIAAFCYEISITTNGLPPLGEWPGILAKSLLAGIVFGLTFSYAMHILFISQALRMVFLSWIVLVGLLVVVIPDPQQRPLPVITQNPLVDDSPYIFIGIVGGLFPLFILGYLRWYLIKVSEYGRGFPINGLRDSLVAQSMIHRPGSASLAMCIRKERQVETADILPAG